MLNDDDEQDLRNELEEADKELKEARAELAKLKLYPAFMRKEAGKERNDYLTLRKECDTLKDKIENERKISIEYFELCRDLHLIWGYGHEGAFIIAMPDSAEKRLARVRELMKEYPDLEMCRDAFEKEVGE